MNKLHFIWAVNRLNTGDWVASPLNYYYSFFKQYSLIVHDICDVQLSEIYEDDIVILGGGGMLDLCDEWNATINRLTDICANVIVWGCGFNSHYRSKKIKIELKVERIKLFAVRDYGFDDHTWLPCVTCKILELDRKAPTKRHIGVITHYANTLKGFVAYDRITNGQNIGTILNFIASSDIVVSNSYHALYWTMLMGKKAVCSDMFSTRFENFKYKPAYFSGNIEIDVKKAQIYDIAEARALNDSFFEQVKMLVEDKIPVSDNSYTDIFLYKHKTESKRTRSLSATFKKIISTRWIVK